MKILKQKALSLSMMSTFVDYFIFDMLQMGRLKTKQKYFLSFLHVSVSAFSN